MAMSTMEPAMAVVVTVEMVEVVTVEIIIYKFSLDKLRLRSCVDNNLL